MKIHSIIEHTTIQKDRKARQAESYLLQLHYIFQQPCILYTHRIESSSF